MKRDRLGVVKMKDLVIFGNSNFSKILKWYIDHDDERNVVAFCTEKEYIQQNTFLGLPIVSVDQVATKYPPENYDILLGIGYRNMNNIRKDVFQGLKKKNYTIASYTHSSAIIQTSEIGEGNIILENTLLCPYVSIGVGNLIWNNVSLAHDCEVGNFNTISGMAAIAGFVKIQNNCFVGKGAVIADNLTINNEALIGAASFVSKDVAEKKVVVANKSTVLVDKESKDFL